MPLGSVEPRKPHVEHVVVLEYLWPSRYTIVNDMAWLDVTGVWLVPCALPPLNIEMKIVRGWDDNLTWEPFPYENKHARLMDYSQVINAHWAAKDVARIGQ